MFNEAQALPEDPAELREAAEGLVALVKTQALRIAKLEHQLAGLRRHRFGSTAEGLDQLQLRLEDDEIATARADRAAPPRIRRRAEGCQAQAAAGAPAAPGDRALARRGLWRVRRQAQNAGRGGHEAGLPAGSVRGEPDRAPAPGLHLLRGHPPGALAVAPDRAGRPDLGLLARVLVAKYGDHCVSRTPQRWRRGAVRR